MVRIASLLFAVLLSVLTLDASAGPPKTPRITRVHIVKSTHVLELFAGEERVASYVASIGPGGPGPKQQEGDQRTPVGRYHVTMHQPSRYRVFLRLDYPNAEDRARFEREKRAGNLHKEARIGGDIGIHGPPVSFGAEEKLALEGHDWTLGCVAVKDEEIVEIAKRVADGTVVDIED